MCRVYVKKGLITMNLKRTLSTVMASAVALSGFSAFGVSAETFETAGDYVSGNAGITFQTNGNYTFRDITRKGDDHAVFPKKEVGCAGGANGFSSIDAKDAAIKGDGTYTVAIPTCGVIDIEPDLNKPANKKAWWINEEKGVSRMGSKWDMRGSYEPPESDDPDAEIPGKDQWVLNNGNDSFNMLGISTDIPAYYDKDSHRCYLDEALTKEVTVSDVTVDIPGAGSFSSDAGCWKDDVDTLCISLINVYDDTGNGNTINASAFPKDEGTITVTFTIKGLGDASAKTDLSKKGKLTVSKKKAAYTGKALKPAVTVKADGKTLKNGTDYTVAYKNNKKPGKATVTVTGKGSYTGKLSGSFIITPKKQAAPTVKALGKGKVKITVKKDKLASGYKVQYSTDKKFKKGVKTITLKKNTKITKTVKLKKGKKYFVRSAAYVKVGKTAYAGKFSKAKAVKVK